MEPTKLLSERQQRMLRFIPAYTARHGYPPAIRDFMSALSIPSTSMVSYHLKILENAGLIERDETKSRGLRVVDPAPTFPPLTLAEADDLKYFINRQYGKRVLAVTQPHGDGFAVLIVGRET